MLLENRIRVNIRANCSGDVHVWNTAITYKEDGAMPRGLMMS